MWQIPLHQAADAICQSVWLSATQLGCSVLSPPSHFTAFLWACSKQPNTQLEKRVISNGSWESASSWVKHASAPHSSTGQNKTCIAAWHISWARAAILDETLQLGCPNIPRGSQYSASQTLVSLALGIYSISHCFPKHGADSGAHRTLVHQAMA